MTKIVKVSVPKWGYPVDPAEVPFLRQSPDNTGIWGDFEFVINQELDSCDYWVVFDQIPNEETCKCPRENTVFITGEPPLIGKYPKVFLDQFSGIISPHRNLPHKNVYHYLPCHPWFINKSYSELCGTDLVEKKKLMCLITTKKYPKRHEIALKLKDYFGDSLDLFGIGINPSNDKWEILAPYKYAIVLENFVQPDWITEKLFDAYLCLTYPFYCGAPNANDYYPANSFTKIDPYADLESTIVIIEGVLKAGWYPWVYSECLRQAKYLTLNKYNFFPLIVNYIRRENLSPSSRKSEITISDKGRLQKNALMFLAKKGII